VKFRLLSFVVGLCLSIALSAGPGFAQAQELKPEPELVRQMLQEGWSKVAEGVLQRTEWGQVETFTYGEEGLRWTARKLEARLEFLEKEYASNPSEELAGIIQSLESQLIETDDVMTSGVAGADLVSPDELMNCSISYWATAAADRRTDVVGVTANASAYFHSNCGHIGNSYAYARAEATAGTVFTTKTQEDPRLDSSWVDSAASAAVSGSTTCYSEAFAKAWSPQLNITYEVSDTNYSCEPPVTPLQTSLSGPSDVWLDDYSQSCQTVTWYASPSGGTPGYTYQWYVNGYAVAGTGSSLSRTYCSTNQGVEVRVVVTDSSYPAKTAESTFFTWIYYEPSCSSNCTCYEEDPWREERMLRPPVF